MKKLTIISIFCVFCIFSFAIAADVPLNPSDYEFHFTDSPIKQLYLVGPKQSNGWETYYKYVITDQTTMDIAKSFLAIILYAQSNGKPIHLMVSPMAGSSCSCEFTISDIYIKS